MNDVNAAGLRRVRMQAARRASRPRARAEGSASPEDLRGSLESMAVFVRLARAGSFTAAAHALGSATSSVSKCVSRLEDRLGVRLVERTTRSFALTEAGLIFRRHCERILRHVEEATLAVSACSPPSKAQISRAFDARLTGVTGEDPDERPYPNLRDPEVVLP
jgi:hypothetical protein